MSTEPRPETSEHVAELRAALQHAVRLISFAAGQEAVSDPASAARMMAAVEEMTDVLARTAPEQPAGSTQA